ncbi:MAG: hypothetical protein AAF549_01565 [Pseudomonadota bacterium]
MFRLRELASRLFGSGSTVEDASEPTISDLYQYVASRYQTYATPVYGLTSQVLEERGFSDTPEEHKEIVFSYLQNSYNEFLQARRNCLWALSTASAHSLYSNRSPVAGQQLYDHPRARMKSNLRDSELEYLNASKAYANMQHALSTLFFIDENFYHQMHTILFDEDVAKADASISFLDLQEIVEQGADMGYWSERLKGLVISADNNPGMSLSNDVETTTNVSLLFDELSVAYINVADMIKTRPQRPLRFDSGHTRDSCSLK